MRERLRSLWPDLLASERQLLVLLGAASFFGQYDTQLFSLLLVQIQEDLAIPDAALGYLGSLTRLGALPAFGVLLLADRYGRRSVLLFTIAGYTTMTAATALSPSYAWFVACQFGASGFLAAELLLSLIVIVEEFRPEHRGWGVGVAGALAVLGRGLALGLFGFVEEIPFGWRGLYAVGVVPLLFLAVLRRRLPETRRFRALVEAVSEAEPPRDVRTRFLRPLVRLARAYPGRFAAVAGLGFLWSFSNAPVDFFLPKYAQEILGWSPGEVSRVALGAGAVGLLGLLLGGWVSDRFGRRPAFVVFLVLEPTFAIILYTVSESFMVALFVLWSFASVANDTIGRTYTNEVFPTSGRSTAAGARATAAAAGGVAGLATESLLFAFFDTHWIAVRAIAATGLAMPLLVWAALPETAGRTLEAIAPEPRAPAPEPARRKAASADRVGFRIPGPGGDTSPVRAAAEDRGPR